MLGVVSRTVFPLSGRFETPASLVSANGRPWDLAVAGQPFVLASSEETPLLRQTAPIKKDQQDTEAEPGEQSLAGWWLRSQASFHEGAGALYQEAFGYEANSGRYRTSNRFNDSLGVDVWTPGQVSLLRQSNPFKLAANTSLLASGVDGTTPVVFQASGNSLYRVTDVGVSTTVSWGGSGTIIDLEVWDGFYYATDSTGVWKGTIAGGAGAKLWTLSSPGTVKYRRVGGFALLLVDNVVYDATVETGAPTLPTAMLTLKEVGWKWTGITRANGTLRAAGHSSGQTAIWRFTPTISSSGWTFGQATGLPRGEIVYSMTSYYNNYLVLGTNKGVRFATFTDDTQYTFGPVTWTVPTGGGPVRGITTIGQYVYATAENAHPDGGSGLVRIDPETELTDASAPGHFAWANDLRAQVSGVLGDVVDLNGRPVYAVFAIGSLIQDASALETTGYLTTGRIRFRTLEPKIFKLLRIRADALSGSISATATGDSGSSAPVATWSVAGSIDLDEAALPQAIGPQEALALTFTLARASATSGPTLRSYQIKALPAPKRARMFQLPLDCFDAETGYTGQNLGYSGFALDRLEALEAAEEGGDVVVYQDFRTNTARLCTIEGIEFRQTSPPGKTAWGGKILLTLRTAT